MRKAYEIACEAPRDNLAGFMISAIRNGYEKAVKTEGSGKKQNTKNKFTDFPQREYTDADFRELELKKLNRS